MQQHKAHWKGTKLIVIIMVTLWFFFAVIIPFLLTDWLNQFRWGGFPFGFWMSMQGSIIVFVILLAVYVVLMNRLDKKHGMKEEKEP